MPWLRAASALGLLLAAGAAPAQERVEITGSRIKLLQAQLSGVGPVSVIDAEAIARSGAVTLETLLQRLPVSAGTAGNQSSAYWTLNGYGASHVNLRGLGIDRTLVLLNGRRVVASGGGANIAVDLNTIPLGMIERVEVLKDGASAIYGADAVAGVVNIITRKPVEGREAALRYGQTARGDGKSQAADLLWGARFGGASVMAGLNYAESGTVPMASRAPCSLAQVGNELVCSGSSSTSGGRARLANGSRVNFNQDPGGNPRGYEPYNVLKHGYNSNEILNAVNPLRKIGLSAVGSLALPELGERTELFGELLATHRESAQQASPGTLGAFRAINIGAAHPTNPTGQDLLLERRRVAEAGPRQFTQQTDNVRLVAGIKGVLDGRWDWSASLNWGHNTSRDKTTNVMNLDRVDATLNRAGCGSGPGAAPCGNYLGYGNLSQAVLDYIHFTARDSGGNDQKAFSATVNGDLFNAPAGAAGFAAGVELRRERGWRNPDPLVASGAANTNAQSPFSGGYNVRELYAELSMPLLAGVPLAHALRATAAGRVSGYSLFGSKQTYKLGLDWQVASALKLRANKSTAFRVPTVLELFSGVTEGALATTDPCNNWSSLSPDSVVYKNCQASGVPAGFRQVASTILTTGGGNRSLEPEHADTYTVGAVWTPASWLTLTADYFDIDIANAIEAVPGSTKLSVCYNSPGLSHLFCRATSFTRERQTGDINFLSSQPENAARVRSAGVDLGALATLALDGWQATLSAEATRLRRYDVTPFPGGATIAYAGKITGGRGSYAEWRGQSALTLARGPWSGSYSVQYIGAADDINAVTPAAMAAIGARAGAVAYHGASLKFAAGKGVTLALGVDNLFDKKAPYIQSWIDANTDTMTYDLLGRRWHLRASLKF